MPSTSLNPFPHNAPHPPTAFGRGPLPLPKGEGFTCAPCFPAIQCPDCLSGHNPVTGTLRRRYIALPASH